MLNLRRAARVEVCTTELGRAHQLAGEFAKRGVQLVALSCDDTESRSGNPRCVESDVTAGSLSRHF